MPTVPWMWFGSRAMLDSSPTTNITQTQANAAIGWEAFGSDELEPIPVFGPTGTGVWEPTYQSGTTTFTYTAPDDTAETSSQVRTFMNATLELYIPDGAGGLTTTTRVGVLMQTNAGDVFFRPSASTVGSWDDIDTLAGIRVIAASPLASNTNMAQIGFSTSIYDLNIVCFLRGTRIATPSGEIAVENLRAGDLVLTKDNGPQAIRWIGSVRLNAAALTAAPHLRPIRFRAGVLGDNTPCTDLLVSPQHRILVRSKIAQRMFGTTEVLVAAKQLLGIESVEIVDDLAEVEYFHFPCDRHEIVSSNGAETETLFTGSQALEALGKAAIAELHTLFPQLKSPDHQPEAARPPVTGRAGRTMAARHKQNGKALVQ